ncbi:MAG: phosphoribosyltransferase family protein [Pleurocapsa sp. MO_192.B19]|nr:phosphoribosyltransferase family protein [Pleurocapsa sp. MO_192.B19]
MGRQYQKRSQIKDVILVEDIVDIGITTNTALEYLQNYQPASLRLFALLDKPAHRQVLIKINYLEEN